MMYDRLTVNPEHAASNLEGVIRRAPRRRIRYEGGARGSVLRSATARSPDVRSTAMKSGVAGLSGPLALVLLLPMEAGLPIPLPADLVMFTVGER